MKRSRLPYWLIFVFLFKFCLILSFLFSAAFSNFTAAEESAFIENSSFEETSAGGAASLPQGWSGPQKNFAQDSEFAHTGKASLRWENQDPKTYALSHLALKTLVPGDSYVITGWVKTKDVKGGKASICVEWSDENGKWLGGAYLMGLQGTCDWTKINGLAHVPENATSPHITCYGTNGAVGTAWFDDLTMERYIPPCITAMTTDRYRAETIGGTVRVRVGVLYKTDEFSETQKKRFQLEIFDEAQKKTETLLPTAWFHDSVEFLVDSDALSCGKYTLRATVPNPENDALETCDLTLKKLEKFPERKSYIDAHNRLIVDGKPFFPLGLYFHNPSPEDIERLKNSPFNCIMAYPQLSRETLDALHEAGIASIYSVKDFYEGLACKTDDEGRERTSKKIEELKDHPAIIAWYINDELPLSMRETLAAHRDLVEELDPGRPAWVVLYQIEEIREYIPTFDVIGTDPYPISAKSASLAWDWSRRTNEAVFGFHANWQVPQYFNWANYRQNDKNTRTPTFDEMRAMTWMSIAGGANGIVGYSYFDFCRNYCGREADAAQKQESLERTWKDVSRIGNEIKSYENVLLSIDTPAEIPTETGSELEFVAIRRYAFEGAQWILAVNTSTEPRTVIFTLPEGAAVQNADAWTGVRLTQEGRTLRVEMNALQPIFLKIK